MESELSGILEARGFRVTVSRVSYRRITGGVHRTLRVVGRRGGAVVTVTIPEGGGPARLHVSARGAGEGEAEALESLGASVDVDEYGLVAVFKDVEPGEVGRLLRGVLDAIAP